MLDGAAETDYARRYRANQDLPAVLSRWGGTLPPSRVHVVTCPPPDADPQVLWERFAGVLGVDPERFPAAGPGAANTSLGTTEIDLLRRVNVALAKRLVQPEYGRVVKQLYAQEILPARRSARPVVPAEMYDDLAVVGERWAKEIDKAGYVVHGDLASLVPVAPAEPGPAPGRRRPARRARVGRRGHRRAARRDPAPRRRRRASRGRERQAPQEAQAPQAPPEGRRGRLTRRVVRDVLHLPAVETSQTSRTTPTGGPDAD